MATWKLPPQVSTWINHLSQPLHGRLGWRLLPLLSGMLFAQGRRTVACWLRAGDLGHDYKPFYRFVGSVGRHTGMIASRLLRLLVSQLPLPERLLFALDDTPTKRAGPLVEGAGIHHNPTPGPAEQKFLYGHVWVTIAWIVQHPRWGVIGLPLRALLYIRRKDLGTIAPWNRKHFPFRTKLELAAELVLWVTDWLRFLGKTIWIVADGAYAKRPFVQAVLRAGAVLVSRLRKDAALWSLADRAAIEQDFHDIKEVHGAGQQQVRHVFANLAVFNLNLWLHTLIEVWAWDQPAKKLRDRSASPWDDPERRPSHADRRNAMRRAGIQETFSATEALATLSRKSRNLLCRLVKLVA